MNPSHKHVNAVGLSESLNVYPEAPVIGKIIVYPPGRMCSRKASLLGSTMTDAEEDPGGGRLTKPHCPTVQKQGWGGKPPPTLCERAL